jgi:hypothetical protein
MMNMWLKVRQQDYGFKLLGGVKCWPMVFRKGKILIIIWTNNLIVVIINTNI